jgi:hypothetical protein
LKGYGEEVEGEEELLRERGDKKEMLIISGTVLSYFGS